jgi:hypothetical protein
MLRNALVKLALFVSLAIPGAAFAGDAPDLQQQIKAAGGWKSFGPVIIVLQGGGSCSCELRDPETGVCQLWVCGNQDAKNRWGPIQVRRPVVK